MEEIQLMEELGKNDALVRSNFKRYREEYANQYIAVDNAKVIAHNASLQKLREFLAEKKQETITTLIEFIPKKGVEILF